MNNHEQVLNRQVDETTPTLLVNTDRIETIGLRYIYIGSLGIKPKDLLTRVVLTKSIHSRLLG